MTLPQAQTRFLFFTGKGGVGKTSLSCAKGLALADTGKRVLIVSTDPASNLDEVLGTPLRTVPTAIHGVPTLFALNIDPVAAAAAYRERMVGPYRGVLPAAAIQSMEEQLSGACTVEIAAFDEFSKLLGDERATADFDHVIFDTAPTGHTLRLLTLPSAWNEFIGTSNGGASCLGPLAGLEKQKALYAATVARLSDGAQTTVILVARADAAAFREAERTRGELAGLGIHNLAIAINGLFIEPESNDPIAAAMAQRSAAALDALPAGLAQLAGTIVPFLPQGTVGLDALRLMAHPDLRPSLGASVPPEAPDVPQGLAAMVDEIAAGGHGVIMTMGKGGVGKTTVAAAIALGLARRGHAVTLSTTDPAAHVADSLADTVPGLSVTRIDPAKEVADYAAEVLRTAASTLDADALALLEEDLRSPCTEEIAVFRAFARTVDQGRDGFVVLDTAPTGHTVLLLDAAEAYHREVLRTQGETPAPVRALLSRLRDPAFTRVLIVTLPEATPVHEAARLQTDLDRAGIPSFAWVVNQSLLASGTREPVLAERASHEAPFIRQVARTLSPKTAIVPYLAAPPVGLHGLAQFIA